MLAAEGYSASGEKERQARPLAGEKEKVTTQAWG
jgi:hypothetical protein